MSNISRISAKLTASSKQFDSTFQKAMKGLMGFATGADKLNKVKVGGGISKIPAKADEGSSALSMLGSAAKYAAVALAGLSVVGAAKYVVGLAKASIETDRLAQSIGVMYEDLDATQAMMKSVGGNADDAADILSRMSQFAESSASGSIANRDILTRMGLDPDRLKDLDPTAQLAVIGNAIARLGTEEEKAAAAAAIFGDKASSALPLLLQNATGVNAVTDAVNKYGTGLSSVDISKFKQGQQALEQLQTRAEQFALRIAAEVVPSIVAIADEVMAILPSASQFGDYIQSIGAALFFVFGVMLNNFNAMMIAFDGIQLGFLAFARTGTRAIELLVNSIQPLLKVLGVLKETLDPKSISDSMRRARQAIDDEQKNIGKALTDRINGGFVDPLQFATKAEDMRKKMEETAKRMNDTRKTQNMAVKLNPLAEEGKRTIEENATAFEKYESRIKSLDRQLQSNAISWETYGRAVAKATQELEDAQGFSIALPNALQRGSSEALSQLNRSRAENELKNMETPQQRLERLQNQANDIAAKTRDYTKEVADAVKGRKVLDVRR